MINVTLETDELGIWLIDDTPQGPEQMGFISWKEVTRGVQAALLQEGKVTIPKLEEDTPYQTGGLSESSNSRR